MLREEEERGDEEGRKRERERERERGIEEKKMSYG